MRLFVAGLLVLVPVLSDFHHALAQQGCPPLPDGTPSPDLRVTAQQVEEGGASLNEFVLAARDGYDALAEKFPTLEAVARFGCLIRQDASHSPSRSTYVVVLTLDGRVFVHPKDMSLSGRQLDFPIYGEILSGLGVSSTDLSGLTSSDPAVLDQAGASILGVLLRQPDGSFDATTAVPSVRPGIPGVSGHAAAVFPAVQGAPPLLLVGGFDLNESHVIHEEIDYGDPAITAKDVVDRETLKAFVAEAIRFIVDSLSNVDPHVLSKMRIALRDPKGPWRHGSAYLYVLDRNSNIILSHGAFPDRFELRPLVATVRDAVTGKLILPQVIEAAGSGPEGGFVEYYFDDPTDDSDSADIPKLGYSREFTGQIQRTDGVVVPVNITVGSGFYGTTPTALDFAHFANGGSFSSDVVLVNLAATPIQPLVYFYGKDGGLIDPGSMVDIVGNLETTDFGALTLQSELPSRGEITISTNGMGDFVTGSVKVIVKDPDSPIGGVLRFDAPGIGVAGVGASQPVRDAIIPVRRQMGGINTGAALRNLSESELTLTCHLMMGGETIETQPVALPANGQTATFISELFEHDTSEFTGSMRCTAPPGAQKFTGVAVELDAMNRIFTTLPVIPLSGDASSDEEMTPEE